MANTKEYNREYYRKHRTRLLEDHAEWRARNVESQKVRMTRWRRDNPCYETERRVARRVKALELLGGRCCKCGFDDVRALQIDHVNGGGVRECREVGSDGIVSRVLRGESGYQLLCANCNWIKRWENGEQSKGRYHAAE